MKIETVLKEFSTRKRETNDYAFETVRREIRELTGEKVGKETVKNFYYGEGDPKFNTVKCQLWDVDSKEISDSLDAE